MKVRILSLAHRMHNLPCSWLALLQASSQGKSNVKHAVCVTTMTLKQLGTSTASTQRRGHTPPTSNYFLRICRVEHPRFNVCALMVLCPHGWFCVLMVSYGSRVFTLATSHQLGQKTFLITIYAFLHSGFTHFLFMSLERNPECGNRTSTH